MTWAETHEALAARHQHDDIQWFSLADLASIELADEACPALLQAAVEWQPETP